MVNTINKLIELNKDDDLVIEVISELLQDMNLYVDKVNSLEYLKMFRQTMDKDEYLQKFHDLDAAISRTNDGIIKNIKLINRICRQLRIEPLYKGNEDNRY